MVKTLSLTAILFMFSCSEKKADDHVAFNSDLYDLDNYSERVHDFLIDRPETKKQSDYNAVFVNTENCAACMRSAFIGIEPFLSKTSQKTFIYANDSTLKKLVPANDNLQFICLPAAAFHEKEIFHTELYMYTMHKYSISSTYLNLPAADSLNKL